MTVAYMQAYSCKAIDQMSQTNRLVVLLFTDIVGSVDLQHRLGTNRYSTLLNHHDDLFQTSLKPAEESKILKDTGDGCLAQFKTSTDAVNAALRFQANLSAADWEDEQPQVRIGLHQGQIIEVDSNEADTTKLIGMPINIASRVMDLAAGGQILMTRAIFDDTRHFLRSHPKVGEGGETPSIEWKAHGRYKFKGAEEPLEVFEVGAVGLAPLTQPEDSEKAKRAVNADEEETLGWRPGVGLEIPSRKDWTLEKP
ncbi:MAG TPA: hypothetical protein EYG38_21370, partial [Verrucomicrobia bacterium]|nr:hypothetical protein [Verrucomicrobiota bacterium]